MHLPIWLLFAALVLFFWGIFGIFTKLSTNHISAESALIWTIVGLVLLQPFVYPSRSLFHYSTRSLLWGLLSGLLSNLGAWGLYGALKSGGKASIVAPFCALYPLVVVLASPFVLHESITPLQGTGILCTLVAVLLLST